MLSNRFAPMPARFDRDFEPLCDGRAIHWQLAVRYGKASVRQMRGEWQPWLLDTFVRFLFSEGGTRVTDNDSLPSLRRFERPWKNRPTHLLWSAGKTEPLREKELRDTLLDHRRFRSL